LIVAAIGLFTFLDVRSHSWGIALGGLAVAVAFSVGGVRSYLRHTHAGPDGLVIQGFVRRTTIPWAEVDHFSLRPHRPGLTDRILVHLTDGRVLPLVHQDSRSLAVNQQASTEFYRTLIERLETVRRTAGH
jgi:hypothetical protein